MTAMQIQEALLQAEPHERLPLAAQLIAQYLALEDAELDAQERQDALVKLEAKLARR